jgi:hypothetical protein
MLSALYNDLRLESMDKEAVAGQFKSIITVFLLGTE